ncbi:hypothetical protein ACFSJM_08435 [Lactococcus formosensis subsp. bovis]|uniref:hypothetical protein n=1 Tax=Lactococcus formosensis TaxID=1281486 RepID=UPI001BCB173A|nr:hypothetical protein [Lactococcus formosensis]
MRFKEFWDEGFEPGNKTAAQQLDEFAKNHDCKVVGYQVVRYEGINIERSYILVEVEE